MGQEPWEEGEMMGGEEGLEGNDILAAGRGFEEGT